MVNIEGKYTSQHHILYPKFDVVPYKFVCVCSYVLCVLCMLCIVDCLMLYIGSLDERYSQERNCCSPQWDTTHHERGVTHYTLYNV